MDRDTGEPRTEVWYCLVEHSHRCLLESLLLFCWPGNLIYACNTQKRPIQLADVLMRELGQFIQLPQNLEARLLLNVRQLLFTFLNWCLDDTIYNLFKGMLCVLVRD